LLYFWLPRACWPLLCFCCPLMIFVGRFGFELQKACHDKQVCYQSKVHIARGGGGGGEGLILKKIHLLCDFMFSRNGFLSCGWSIETRTTLLIAPPYSTASVVCRVESCHSKLDYSKRITEEGGKRTKAMSSLLL
jgi:hypothetical protein